METRCQKNTVLARQNVKHWRALKKRMCGDKKMTWDKYVQGVIVVSLQKYQLCIKFHVPILDVKTMMIVQFLHNILAIYKTLQHNVEICLSY